MQIHELILIFTSAFVALFPVVNPIGDGFIINGFLKDLDEEQRKIAAKKIFINCFMIGVGSLVIGHFVLLLFGLAIPAVQVGGGFIIIKTGMDMLTGNPSSYNKDNQKTIDKITMEELEQKIFYPISFPISVGPGSISVIFTLMASATVKGNLLHTGVNYLVIAAALFAILIILYVFILRGRLMKKMGKSGSLIINKLIAFITLCIGIQIMARGISDMFHLSYM